MELWNELPPVYNYELGFNNSVFYDFLIEQTDIPHFDQIGFNPDKADMFRMVCGQKDGKLSRVLKNPSAKAMKKFEKLLNSQTQFLFCIQIVGKNCKLKELSGELTGKTVVVCLFNTELETIELLSPEYPLIANWTLQLESVLEDEFSDSIQEVKRPGVPSYIVDRYNLSSVAKAYVPFVITYSLFRIDNTETATDDMIEEVAQIANDEEYRDNLQSYIKKLKEYISKFKCKPNELFHPELNKCVPASEIVGRRVTTSPVKIRYGESVVKGKKLVSEFAEGSGEESFMIDESSIMGGLLLKYPYLSAPIPDIESGYMDVITWDQPYRKSPKAEWKALYEGDIANRQYKLFWPESITTLFKKAMLDDKVRFVAVNLQIVDKCPPSEEDCDSHANFLIYDKTTNEIERWEPHGSNEFFYFEENEIDSMEKALQAKLNTILPKGYKYFKPLDFCPMATKVSDLFQRDERSDLLSDDDQGLCATWAFWYLETRLKNPETPRDIVVKEAAKAFKPMIGNKAFIRRYKSYLEELAPKHLTKEELIKEIKELRKGLSSIKLVDKDSFSPKDWDSLPISFKYEMGQNNIVLMNWAEKNFGYKCFDTEKSWKSGDVFRYVWNDEKGELYLPTNIDDFDEWLEDEERFLFNIQCQVEKHTFVVLCLFIRELNVVEFFFPEITLLNKLPINIFNKLSFELSDRIDDGYEPTLSFAFVDKFNFDSMAKAYLCFILYYIELRSFEDMSMNELSDLITEKATITSLKRLLDTYKADLLKLYNCKPPLVFNSETNKCVEASQLSLFDITNPSPAKIRLGMSVVKGKKVEGQFALAKDEDAYQIDVALVYAYLLMKFPSVGSTIPNIEKKSYKTIYWRPIEQYSTEMELVIGDSIIDMIRREIANPYKRFIMIDCTLIEICTKEEDEEGDCEGHSNVLLYDKLTNEIELWEPFGTTEKGLENFKLTEFYTHLAAKIAYLEDEGVFPANVKFFTPIDYCPIGTKHFQVDERGEVVKNNDLGLCMTWSFWYLETRLKNPQFDRTTVVKEAAKEFKKMIGNKLFIRRFKTYLEEQIQKVKLLSQEEFETILKSQEDIQLSPLPTALVSPTLPSTPIEPSPIEPSPIESRDEIEITEPEFELSPSERERISPSPQLEVEEIEDEEFEEEVQEVLEDYVLQKGKLKRDCSPQPPYRWIPANKKLGVKRGYCEKDRLFVTEKCRKWLDLPQINPDSGRVIFPGKEAYLKLIKECGEPSVNPIMIEAGDLQLVSLKAASDGNCFFDSLTQLIDKKYDGTKKRLLAFRKKMADLFTLSDFLEVNNSQFALEAVADLLFDPSAIGSPESLKQQLDLLSSEDKEEANARLEDAYEARKNEIAKNGFWAEDWMIGFISKKLDINIFVYNDAAQQFFITTGLLNNRSAVFLYNFDQAHFEPLVGQRKKRIWKWAEIQSVIPTLPFM